MKRLVILILLVLSFVSKMYAKNIDDDFYTVLVIGVDSRYSNYNGNTDMMLIASYNKQTCEINCVSIQRDTYIKNTDGEWCKVNAIYHKKGLNSLIETLNKTYNLNISRHVIINWRDAKHIIDLLGYVNVNLTDAEFNYINAYIHETALSCGETNPAKYYVDRNVKVLTGIQAIAYARLRVMDSDRKRMERQQKVMVGAISKFITLSTVNKLGVIKDLNDTINTNFGPSEIVNIVKSVNNIKINQTKISPNNDNYCVLKGIGEWACMPKNWCKESSIILNVLYKKYKTPTEYINNLEKDSRRLRK